MKVPQKTLCTRVPISLIGDLRGILNEVSHPRATYADEIVMLKEIVNRTQQLGLEGLKIMDDINCIEFED